MTIAKELAETYADANRYRWLKSRVQLQLSSEREYCEWTRQDGSKFYASHYLAEGGTQHAPAESLDETIDKAMKIQIQRDSIRALGDE